MIDTDYTAIRTLIYGQKSVMGATWVELADDMGLSANTLRERIKHPEKLTVRDIRNLSHLLRIPPDHMRHALIAGR